MLPEALIVSDFPILGKTAEMVLQDRYRVVTRTWQRFCELDNPGAPLAIIDITAIDRTTALKLVGIVLPEAQVVLCSLHRNEIEVYRVREGGVTHEADLQSLLHFVA